MENVNFYVVESCENCEWFKPSCLKEVKLHPSEKCNFFIYAGHLGITTKTYDGYVGNGNIDCHHTASGQKYRQHLIVCPSCGGSGWINDPSLIGITSVGAVQCPACQGMKAVMETIYE